MTEHSPSEPPIDQWSIERLVRGEASGADTTPAARAIAAMVSAARAEATQAELAGESAALAAYTDAMSSVGGRRFRRSSMLSLSGLLAGKIAAAAAAGAVSLGGVAAAAYTGNLPTSLQNFAHDTVGAPAAASHHHDATTPKGPDATGKDAFGLCTAYEATQKDGASPTDSVAFQNLIKAAGGADKVAAYCATVSHPGKSTPNAKPSTHPGAKPSTLPGSEATAHPSGEPTVHPSGEPTPGSGHASTHPAGPPASAGGSHRP